MWGASTETHPADRGEARLICHVSVRVHRKENVGNVIGPRPAIVRKGYRAARIIGENVWQQRSRDAFGVIRRVAA